MNKNHELTEVEKQVIAISQKWDNAEFKRIVQSGRLNYYPEEMKEAFLAEYHYRTQFVNQSDLVE